MSNARNRYFRGFNWTVDDNNARRHVGKYQIYLLTYCYRNYYIPILWKNRGIILWNHNCIFLRNDNNGHFLSNSIHIDRILYLRRCPNSPINSLRKEDLFFYRVGSCFCFDFVKLDYVAVDLLWDRKIRRVLSFTSTYRLKHNDIPCSWRSDQNSIENKYTLHRHRD